MFNKFIELISNLHITDDKCNYFSNYRTLLQNNSKYISKLIKYYDNNKKYIKKIIYIAYYFIIHEETL